MKYQVLLRFLKVLIYCKRFFWWLGPKMYFVVAGVVGAGTRQLLHARYRFSHLKHGHGLTRSWLLKRDILQIFLLASLLILGYGQTKWSTKNWAYASQQTMAYVLIGSDDEGNLEEIVSRPESVSQHPEMASWRVGSLSNAGHALPGANRSFEIGSIVAGGTAFNKPIIMPGATLGGIGGLRNKVVDYIVQPGDSMGLIAEIFDVSVATILWENSLNLRSIIRPGDSLRIPPTSGIMHTVKKGETIKKIASLYEADANRVISFNHLKEDGSNLAAGERIMVPDGIKPAERQIAATTRTQATSRRVATPPSSLARPSTAGWVWPSGARIISQYYGIRHNAIDIAGPWQSPTYAARDGVVEKSQCGWNGGYGCYVIIDHGGGLKTLYGHHSQLLVSPGERVVAGQTIALMGNTGHVRGVTGIHLHFEVIRNGSRLNPLGYVR